MATGATTYADAAALINDIYEGSLLTLRSDNVLVPTVTIFNDTMGMQPRKVTSRTSTNMRAIAEAEDLAATKFGKSLLSTLTPARYGDQILLTDEEVRSDSDDVRMEASDDLGGGASELVDSTIAAYFDNLTGGTVGAALGTVTWSQIFAARSLLVQAKVRGPYFCALGAGQWFHLTNAGGTAGAPTTGFTRSTEFQDRSINNYFVAAPMGDVTFVVCPNITGANTGTAFGALYARIALAYDERDPFNIEPQRDASRGAWELNANLRFAAGLWRPACGITIASTDVIPTT
jgi:hypothetical protein